ncbi:hypothetical protein J3R30DRAFT_3707459 [Lentinula aciculospora]|uniref:F-box domain-containing protein n=1 Tax=Lentinula aciculospora TaxID=153920 RepID=A0A9W9A3U0_9AGAR|nr:hypothetical protein J3R30DRAFT_3707459 [Lentinula aciculospora]
MSSRKLFLHELNIDVLCHILVMLHDVSRHSLLSVLCVNRVLYNITLPVLHRSCVLDYSPNRQQATIARLKSWLEDNSSILSSIRHITVQGTPAYWRRHVSVKAPDTTKWASLIQVLSQLSHLASFTFEYCEQLPIVLLNALHRHHPSTHLHVRNWTRIAPEVPFGDPAEEALANSPCLRSLHALFFTGTGPEADYRFSAFDRIVKLSPNLEDISRISRSGGGCVIYGYSSEQIEANGREIQKFAVDAPKCKCIKSLELDNVDAQMFQKLGAYIHPEQLIRLKSVQPSSDFLQLVTQHPTYKLCSLKHLDVHFGTRFWGPDPDSKINELVTGIAVFFQSCSPLESLTIVLQTSRPWEPILSTILIHHGHSLRLLSLHQVESPKEESRRLCLSLDQLHDIRRACQQLTSLALDVDRTVDGQTEREYYAAIRGCNLRELTIHMDLGIAFFDSLVFFQLNDPSKLNEMAIVSKTKSYSEADESFVMEVWSAVVGTGIVEIPYLQELVLCMGEQNREIGHGYPANWVCDEQHRRQWARVRRSERDDRPREVNVKIRGGRLRQKAT